MEGETQKRLAIFLSQDASIVVVTTARDHVKISVVSAIHQAVRLVDAP